MSHQSKSCTGKHGKPLVAYETKYEAQNGATHAKITYGSEMAPYKCRKCTAWHLSPKERETPSEACHYCRDSHGDSKALYCSEAAAKQRANILGKEKGIHLRVYECPHQQGWHLTKG
jgi:hypothetical protein